MPLTLPGQQTSACFRATSQTSPRVVETVLLVAVGESALICSLTTRVWTTPQLSMVAPFTFRFVPMFVFFFFFVFNVEIQSLDVYFFSDA
jgi:hypothetical protein